MKKRILPGAVFILLCLPLFAVAVQTQPASYSETLPQSAFQESDADSAVIMLLDSNVPISVIISAAIQSGVTEEAIVGALLSAGIPPKDVVRHCLEAHISFQGALKALKKYGVAPDLVLTWLIKWNLGIDGIYDTCAFMLDNEFSKADILRVLKEAEADREIVVQVVRWFDIPPATVVAVYQSFLDYFGHVFNRSALPQPALLSIGVARITPVLDDPCRPVISPMRP